MVVTGDSNVAGLRRYTTVLRNLFLRYKTITLEYEETKLKPFYSALKVSVLLLLLDLFLIATQISRLLLVDYYQGTFTGLRQQKKLRRPMLI